MAEALGDLMAAGELVNLRDKRCYRLPEWPRRRDTPSLFRPLRRAGPRCASDIGLLAGIEVTEAPNTQASFVVQSIREQKRDELVQTAALDREDTEGDARERHQDRRS